VKHLAVEECWLNRRDYSNVGVHLAYCSLHWVDKMSLEGVPNKETFLSQKIADHDRHTFSTHSFIPALSIHPFGWQCMRTLGGKFSFGEVFHLKITMGFSFVPSDRHTSTTGTTISRDQLCWPTQFLHLLHSWFWLMACETRQAFRPCSQCEQVCNFPSFCSFSDYEAVEACDLLEAFGWSSSSVEEQDS